MISNYFIIKKDFFLKQIAIEFKNHKYIECVDFDGTQKLIVDSVCRIKDHKKVIIIADKYGWDVARDYKDD